MHPTSTSVELACLLHVSCSIVFALIAQHRVCYITQTSFALPLVLRCKHAQESRSLSGANRQTWCYMPRAICVQRLGIRLLCHNGIAGDIADRVPLSHSMCSVGAGGRVAVQATALLCYSETRTSICDAADFPISVLSQARSASRRFRSYTACPLEARSWVVVHNRDLRHNSCQLLVKHDNGVSRSLAICLPRNSP